MLYVTVIYTTPEVYNKIGKNDLSNDALSILNNRHCSNLAHDINSFDPPQWNALTCENITTMR